MTSPLLQGLNQAQQKAVQAPAGPVLVLAGPGSGKTRVLTHRVAYLIQEFGVDPLQILAVTFTNKAAREMKERLEKLIGAGQAAELTVGTFHSLCARFLRRDIVHLGRERDFVIYDADDQERLMRRVLRDLNLDEKKNPPRAILGQISSAKNELVSPQEYARLNRSYQDEIVVRCYERYQALLRESNALDFDDLLVETVHLFQQHPQVLAKYHDHYTHLLVDEYQDTNRVQYVLIKLLAAKQRNLFVVGDEDQCVPAGEVVRTAQGQVAIEQIQVGDTLVCGAGQASTAVAKVQRVRSRHYHGHLIQATLRSGRVLRVTPNHMCFARLDLRADRYYVYLLYREDQGYRIGISRGGWAAALHPQALAGLPTAGPQQHAMKVWILNVCPTRAAATDDAQFYAATYAIPALLGDSATHEQCDLSPLASDCGSAGARRLMRDLDISAAYPHSRADNSAASAMSPLRVHFTAFGDAALARSAPWYRHRVWLEGGDQPLGLALHPAGTAIPAEQPNNPRFARSYVQMDRTARVAEALAQAAGDVDLVREAAFTHGEPFAFQPAAQLRPTMLVPVLQDGRVVDDEIVAIESLHYTGMVYDLDVAHLHNYAVNDVLVHNSIYAWRGADIRNILNFEEDYPDAQVILLEQNYRSTQAILDMAQAVLSGGTKRKRIKQLWTQNGAGVQVSLHEGYDQNDEAQWVADEIARLVASNSYKLGDCAVMYRTNAQSRAVEEAMVARGLRYQIIGGIRFYERKEIKDVLAYLRLTYNPYDSVSLGRVLNVPQRGIGERTEAELNRWANELGVPVYQALQELSTMDEKQAPFNARTRSALLAFLRLIDEFIEARMHAPLSELLDLILERLNLREVIQREYGAEEGDERWANVQELRNVAAEYFNLPSEAQLPTFLEEVSLVADVDSMDKQSDVITCITLHQAKGLEYPVVFLIGLEEGLVPHSRSMDDRDKLDEERRLLYVGATRAKERLYLLYAFRRTSYGRTSISTPSRFLTDIPRELLKQPTKRQTSTLASGSMYTQNSSYAPTALNRRRAGAASAGGVRAPKASGPSALSFFPGQLVRHATFGEGVVVSSRLIEGDEEVTVNFAGKERRLLASFARLEKVE